MHSVSCHWLRSEFIPGKHYTINCNVWAVEAIRNIDARLLLARLLGQSRSSPHFAGFVPASALWTPRYCLVILLTEWFSGSYLVDTRVFLDSVAEDEIPAPLFDAPIYVQQLSVFVPCYVRFGHALKFAIESYSLGDRIHKTLRKLLNRRCHQHRNIELL